MPIRSLAPLIAAIAIASAASMPVMAQPAPILALNGASAAPGAERGTWRLTLEFGRADRSPSATARSVDAPALSAQNIVIYGEDGGAAPFIVREVQAPAGNELTLVIEHFGPTPLAAGDRFTVQVLEDEVVTAERSAADFDFLPPALTGG